MADLKALQNLLAQVKGARPAKGMRTEGVTVERRDWKNPQGQTIPTLRIAAPGRKPFTVGVQAVVNLASKSIDTMIAFAREHGVTVADRTADQLEILKSNMSAALDVAQSILEEQAKTAGSPQPATVSASDVQAQIEAAVAAALAAKASEPTK